MVKLVNLYILFDASIHQTCLLGCDLIYYVFYDEPKRLIVAPISFHFFQDIHRKCKTTFLKTRNAQGTRAFQVASLLLDHDIDPTDRDLAYEIRSADEHLLTLFF